MQNITLGYSPCPNDTFIFGGLAKNLIGSSLTYDIVLKDVEDLNRRAMNGELMVTKLSYHAFAYVIDQYEMLPYGSALGFGVGPLLITKDPNIKLEKIKRIAIPGKYTTAHMLLKYALSNQFDVTETLFSKIEDLVSSGEVDAGVIIHENRFTYSERGFTKLLDLGEYWETKTNLPIPLGGIAIKRNLPNRIKQEVVKNIEQSIQLGDSQFSLIEDYIKDHAQEMDIEVMRKHIALYVNASTRGLNGEDEAAIDFILNQIQVREGLKSSKFHWKY